MGKSLSIGTLWRPFRRAKIGRTRMGNSNPPGMVNTCGFGEDRRRANLIRCRSSCQTQPALRLYVLCGLETVPNMGVLPFRAEDQGGGNGMACDGRIEL